MSEQPYHYGMVNHWLPADGSAESRLICYLRLLWRMVYTEIRKIKAEISASGVILLKYRISSNRNPKANTYEPIYGDGVSIFGKYIQEEQSITISLIQTARPSNQLLGTFFPLNWLLSELAHAAVHWFLAAWILTSDLQAAFGQWGTGLIQWPLGPGLPSTGGWEHPSQPGKGLPWQGQTGVIPGATLLLGGSILSSVGLMLLTLTSGNVPEETPGMTGMETAAGKRAEWVSTLLKVPASLSLILYSLRFCRERSRCLPNQLTVTNRITGSTLFWLFYIRAEGHSFPANTATVVVWELLGRVGPSMWKQEGWARSRWNSTIFKTLVSIRSSQQIWPVCLNIVKSPCKITNVPCV